MAYSLSAAGVFHIHRMVIDYGGWNMTVVQALMLQCIYLSYLGWDYSDGADSESKSSSRIIQFPSFLEYLGGGLFPALCMAGPCGHMSDFLNYIYSRKEYADKVHTFVPALKLIGIAMIWISIYGAILTFFPFGWLYEPGFRESNFLVRVSLFLPSSRIDGLLRDLCDWCQGTVLRGLQAG